MTTKIADLQGMTDAIAAVLKERGIASNEQFLEAAATPAQRKELAKAAGCEARDILELANRADLARVKGVSGVYSDLLEHAGVDTVPELAQRRADNLHAKIVEANAEQGLAKQAPSASQVESWVAQAKELGRTIKY